MILKHSLISLIQTYLKDRDLIHAQIASNGLENYDLPASPAGEQLLFLGMFAGMFMFVLLISLVFWIIALYFTYKNWNKIPTWAKIIAVLGLLGVFAGGPVVSLIVVVWPYENYKQIN